jgi:glucose-6-phosphate dehydrogenase assembly protein OpcA
MAKKVLGQANPSATTLTTLYTVPSSTEAVISTISVANLTASDATFRLAVRPGGASIEDKHYIGYDITVGASDSTLITVGLTLAASDVISVYASTADLAFQAFGDEAAV